MRSKVKAQVEVNVEVKVEKISRTELKKPRSRLFLVASKVNGSDLELSILK